MIVTTTTPRSPRSVLASGTAMERSSGGSFSSTSSTSSSSSQSQQQGNSVLFPWKLHEMLRTCVKENRDDVVSWLPQGKAFKVHNVPEFVSKILPLYFKQSKYKSFQRQLNLWGFERLTSGPDKGAYWHTQFLRDDPSLCKHLTRQRAKKAGSSSSSSASSSSSQSSAAAQRAAKASYTSAAAGAMMIGSGSTSNKAANHQNNPLFGPRQVSESSLESFGELLRDLDTSATANIDTTALDLAEFEGFTFHLLEQERYEELNLEFKFVDQASQAAQQQNALPSLPTQEEADVVHTLLEELEQGTFGTPKTNFDATAVGELPISAM